MRCGPTHIGCKNVGCNGKSRIGAGTCPASTVCAHASRQEHSAARPAVRKCGWHHGPEHAETRSIIPSPASAPASCSARTSSASPRSLTTSETVPAASEGKSRKSSIAFRDAVPTEWLMRGSSFRLSDLQRNERIQHRERHSHQHRNVSCFCSVQTTPASRGKYFSGARVPGDHIADPKPSNGRSNENNCFNGLR